MWIDELLEQRVAVTSVTSGKKADVTREAAPVLLVTPVTSVTSENVKGEVAFPDTASSWMLTYPDGRRMQKNCTIPVTREHVLGKFPEVTDAAPISDLDAYGVPDLPGVSPEFAAHLSTDDLSDIAAGDIPLTTVQAYEEAAITKEAEDLRERFEERAGILEHDGGLPKPEAELEAARITATYARNSGYLWASLRTAIADYPALLTVLPDKSSSVDSLPLGVAKVARPARPSSRNVHRRARGQGRCQQFVDPPNKRAMHLSTPIDHPISNIPVTEERDFALIALDPSYGAGQAVSTYTELRSRPSGFDCGTALKSKTKATQVGNLAEEMLLAQAHTLDAIFNSLAIRAEESPGEYGEERESCLRLAYKAQSQCRETLAELTAMQRHPAAAGLDDGLVDDVLAGTVRTHR